MIKNSEKAIFVITNYKFSDANQFSRELELSESFKQNFQDFQKAKIEIKGSIPLPEGFPIPIAVYKKNNTEILYSAGDSRLNISTTDYTNENADMKELLSKLAQFKLQEISAIGINYNADCSVDKRLSIFNEKINDSTIKNWSNNQGFFVTLPIDLTHDYGCFATYYISKVQGETDKNNNIIKPYIYNISVNYNFNINEDKADTIKRYEKLTSIVKSIDSLYDDFNNKCKEITSL